MKKQSFLFGTLILSLSAIICKILGAIYKIPLANVLGTQGMGIYYIVFPLYTFFLAFVSSWFTLAVSKKVSIYVANKNNFLAYKTLTYSLLLQIFISVIICVVLGAFSKIIASLQGYPSAYICYLVISPAIVFVGINSVLKGFFQGLKNMIPSSITQIVEQLFKLSLGFTFATILSKIGTVYGTFGAFLGILVAEIITCVCFIIYFLIYKKKNKKFFEKTQINFSKKQLISQIYKLTIPFSISSTILPLLLVIDSFLIINLLKYMGFESFFATGLLGISSGIISTLISLLTTLALSICMAVIPYISYSLSMLDYKSIQVKVQLTFKLVILITLPSVFIFSIFSPIVLRVFYSGAFESLYEFNLACSLLMISSMNIFYLTLLQVTTSLLQALDRMYIPVISLSISLIFKVIIEVILINNPYINIIGAIISNSVCYFISAFINLIYLKKQLNFSSSFKKGFVLPLILAMFICLINFLTYKTLNIFMSFMASVLISFGISILLYVIGIFVFKIFTKQEAFELFNRKNSVTLN